MILTPYEFKNALNDVFAAAKLSDVDEDEDFAADVPAPPGVKPFVVEEFKFARFLCASFLCVCVLVYKGMNTPSEIRENARLPIWQIVLKRLSFAVASSSVDLREVCLAQFQNF